MKATLTLRKEDLIAKLESRKDEINAEIDAEIKEVQDRLDKRLAAKDDTTAQAEWYAAVAEGLTSGEITLTTTGKLRGAPGKPGTRSVEETKAHGGRGGYDRLAHFSNDQLKNLMEQIESSRAERVKPLTSALDLINLSVDETVEVDSADYQNLLTGNGRNAYRYY